MPPPAQAPAIEMFWEMLRDSLPGTLVVTLLACPWMLAGVAAAQDDATAAYRSPRRVTAMALEGNRPAVLLEDDVAWKPEIGDLSVCGDEGCAPVIEAEACAPPECPGIGMRLELAEAVGDVASWPTSETAFEEEVALLRSDPHFSTLSGYFGYHPNSGGDEDDERGWFLHTGLVGTAATLGTGGGALVGGTGSVGVLLALNGESAYHNEKFQETFFGGDRIRFLVRGMALGALGAQTSRYLGTVGLAVEAENRIEGTAWAVPTFLSMIVPELGASFRGGAPPGFYARFSMPFRLHVTRAAGIEVRFSVTAIEQVDDQGLETLLSLSLGGFHR